MSDVEDDFPSTNRNSRFLRHLENLMAERGNEFLDEQTIENNLKITKFDLPNERIHKCELPKERGNIIPGHLASPITSEDQEAILTYQDKNLRCFRHRSWKYIRRNNKIAYHIYSSYSNCSPHSCTQSVINKISVSHQGFPSMNEIRKRLYRILSLSLRNTCLKKFNFERSMRSILSSFGKYEEEFNKKYAFTNEEINKLLPFYVDKIIAEFAKDLLCNKKIRLGFLRIPHPDFVYDKETVLYYCDIHKVNVLAPTTLIINVLDNFQAEFSIRFSWLLSDKINKYGSHSIYQTGDEIRRLLIRFRERKEIDHYYDFLGKWEALVLGKIIKDPNDEGCSSLYDEIYNSLPDKIKYMVNNYLLPKTTALDEYKMYLELVGMNKTFGHPCIDMKKSLNVVREYGGMSNPVDFYTMNLVLSKIIEIFCKQYYQRHYRYPPLKPSNSKLYRIMALENRPIRRSDKIEYQDFLNLIFDKTFDFDYSFETATFIKDTASAPNFSSWGSSFDDCAFRELYNKPRPSHDYKFDETRVILKFLSGSKEDLMNKVNEIEHGYWNPEHSMCSYCRKEREIKDDGRVFVKQCYDQRLVQVVREHNISQFVFPYFDDQTMTNSEAQVLKKQEQMSQSGATGDNIIINIDLSKWNLHFRDQSVRPVGNFLDQLFGMKNFFKDTHRWFLLCNIFCNSRLCPPDYDIYEKPIPGEFYINNHKGGGEGMCQKLWTLINIGVIRLTGDQQGVNINVMGQGDNQVVVLKLRKDQLKNRNEIRLSFMQALDRNFSAIGLKLKLQETWFSRRVFEYGKQRYIDGMAISSLSKKMGRLIPDINEGILSLQSCLAQINTTTEGCCKTELNATIPFLCNQFEVINYLMRTNIISMKDTDTDIEKFLYFPTILGGFPLSLLFNHTVRGNDDPLPQWLSLIQDLYLFRPELFKKVITIIDLNPSKYKNYKNLLTDIRSLNVRALESTETFVKECTLNFLETNRTIVTNPEITDLFNTNITLHLEDIVRELIKMKPMFLPLAHELLRLSNAGVLLSLQTKLTNVSTITKVVSELTELDFFSHSILLQTKIKTNLRTRYISNSTDIINFIKDQCCPSRLSTYLREIHWNLGMLTPTKPTQNHQFKLLPLDQATGNERDSGIIITVSDIFRESEDLGIMVKGPNDSYIGNKTKEKLIDPIIKLTNRPPSVACYQSLYTIKTWCKQLHANNLEKLVDKLLLEKHYKLPQELQELEDELFCPMISGGNIVHRLKAAIEKRVGIRNTNPSLGSHFSFSTNNMKKYNKGGKDYTLYFQNAYHSAEALITNLKLMNHNIESQYLYIVECEHCTEDVTEERIDLESPPDIYIQPDNSDFLNDNGLKVIDLKDIGNEMEIRHYMSVYIGRIVGRSMDLESSKSYFLNQTDTLVEAGRLGDISTYFIKTIDFRQMIIGIFYESNFIRHLISNNELIFFENTSIETLTKFSNMLIEAERSIDLINWLQIPIINHNEPINPKSLSRSIMRGIIRYYLDNEVELFPRLINPVFSNDSPYKIQTILSWMYNRQYHIRGLPKIITKNPKDLKYPMPSLRLTLQEAISRKNVEEEKLIREMIIKNVTNCYINFLPINTDIILASYKSINTLEKLTMTSFSYKIHDHAINYNHLSLNYIMNMIHLTSQTRDSDNTIKIPFLQHIGRPVGSISSAASKYYEVLNMLGINKTTLRPQISINLAEGSGSVAWLCSLYFNVPFVYNTLMTPDIDLRRHQSLRIPPACCSYKSNILHNQKYKQLTCEGETDITNKSFIDKIRGIFMIEREILVTIDAESTVSTSDFLILQIYLKLMIEYTNIRFMCCKLLIGDDRDWYKEVIEIVDSINIPDSILWTFLKPITSHWCNGEFFIIFYRSRSNVNDTIASRINELKNIYNPDNLSLFPLTGFNMSTLDRYIFHLTSMKHFIYNTLIKYNNIYEYDHKYSNLIKSGWLCGICCLSNCNWLIREISRISSPVTGNNELEMDIQTRHTGLKNCLFNYYMAFYLNIIFNLHKIGTLNIPILKLICNIGIIINSNNVKKCFYWPISEDVPDGYDFYSFYDTEDIKNYYRCGKRCSCDREVIMTPKIFELYSLLNKFEKANLNFLSIKYVVSDQSHINSATMAKTSYIIYKNIIPNFKNHINELLDRISEEYF